MSCRFSRNAREQAIVYGAKRHFDTTLSAAAQEGDATRSHDVACFLPREPQIPLVSRLSLRKCFNFRAKRYVLLLQYQPKKCNNKASRNNSKATDGGFDLRWLQAIRSEDALVDGNESGRDAAVPHGDMVASLLLAER